ncbi:MAG TPA: universal stress protein [Solirubrobacteraceae bacterium]|nr:universal stress protein [Solirubrobacteraceae bacterium]
MEAGRDLAARLGSNLIALDVVAAEPIAQYLSPFGADPIQFPVEILDRNRAAAAKRLDEIEHVEGRAVTGAPYRTLAEFADEVDLLVVGARSHGLVRRSIFGSISLRLARHAQHPVLVIPHIAISHDRPALADGVGSADVGAVATQ